VIAGILREGPESTTRSGCGTARGGLQLAVRDVQDWEGGLITGSLPLALDLLGGGQVRLVMGASGMARGGSLGNCRLTNQCSGDDYLGEFAARLSKRYKQDGGGKRDQLW